MSENPVGIDAAVADGVLVFWRDAVGASAKLPVTIRANDSAWLVIE